MKTETKKDSGSFRITWCDDQGNAACLGLDETVIAESAEEVVRDAVYAAECQGIDTDRYHPEVEFIGWLP